MAKMNFRRLKENVKQLMDERGLRQTELAKAIGMSQPNLNKCLNLSDDSRSFTLEQVCNLSDYFEVTVDELLDRPRKEKDLSVVETCQVLATLISHNQIVHFDHKVNETVVVGYGDELPWSDESNKEVTYDAFYFPNYCHIPDYVDSDNHRYDEVESDILYGGNEMPNNIRINKFINRFIETYERFDSLKISQEEYEILKNAYYQILKKNP